MKDITWNYGDGFPEGTFRNVARESFKMEESLKIK